MSGQIIFSGITTHSPRIGIEARAPDFTRGMIQGVRLMGEEIRAAKPDAIVLMSTHWVTTFPWYTTSHAVHEGHCVADEAPDLIPGIPYRWQGDPALANAITGEIAALGVSTGTNDSPHYSLDYGTVVPMQYLDPGMTVPLVSLGTCILATLDECLAVGGAIRRAVKASGKRVAVVGSTALAHRIERGQDRWPPQAFMDADHRFIEMLTSGRIAEAKAWLPAWAKSVVAEVGGRVVATILGTLAETEEQYRGVQHGPYGQSSASGNASICLHPVA
jgi:3,4-dihydroxyphenylacetate 2,3-dioxygenase